MFLKRFLRVFVALAVLSAWVSSSHLCSLKMAMAVEAEAASCHANKSSSNCCESDCCMDAAESAAPRIQIAVFSKTDIIPSLKTDILAGLSSYNSTLTPQHQDFVPQVYFTQAVLNHTYSFHSPPLLAR